MNKKILLMVICLVMNIGKLFSQEIAKSTTGYDRPVYVVIYEIIPNKQEDCVYPINTIIFEIPVDEEYFNSISVNQEATSWFKTNGNSYLIGAINPTDMTNKWKLIVRGKRIVSK